MSRAKDFAIDVSVHGIEKAVKMFNKIDAKLYRDTMRKALRAGAKIVLAKAKEDLPQKTGDTVRSLRVRAGKRDRKKRVIRFRVVETAQKGKDATFYWRFVEWGTVRVKAVVSYYIIQNL